MSAMLCTLALLAKDWLTSARLSYANQIFWADVIH